MPALQWIRPQPCQLHQDARDEERVVDQVPVGETPWLLHQAKEPLEPAALNPSWRLALEAGVEIKRRTDRDERRRGQQRPVASDPVVLFRRPEPDPDDIGTSRIEGLEHVGILLGVHAPKWRRVRPRDDELRKALAKSANEQVGHSWTAAV